MCTTKMSKRQKVVHLSQQAWLLQRPDAFVGAMEPVELKIIDFVAGATATVCVSPGFVALLNELFTNPLDNCQRDDTQRNIRITCEDGTLVVSNDGSTLPVEKVDDEWVITKAFGTFQTGSNFDTETGEKDTVFTAGRNGVGAKGCNVFSKRFVVRVVNAEDKKAFAQTWEDNMTVLHEPKIVASTRKTNETTVEWSPDFERLGPSARDCMPDLCRWLAHNVSLCAPPAVKVSFNGETLKLRSVEHFCRALGGVGPIATDTVEHEGKQVLRIAVAARETPVQAQGLTYAFVNGTSCCDGSHARYLFGKVAEVVEARARTRRGATDVRVTSSFLSTNAVVVALVLVRRERFTDQRKTCLDVPVKDYGWTWTLSPAFRSALERSALVDRAVAAAHDKDDADAKKATKVTRAPVIAKYESATKRFANESTLIVCEGDSAANLVRSGLSAIDRKPYGLYPLKGKFLNARDMAQKDILKNKEAQDLLKILGIQLGTEFTAEGVRKMPYARLMVATDQDVDGAHIAGLLFNFIDVCAPTLLVHRPEFLVRFVTPLIRVGGHDFHSQVEYDRWCQAGNTGKAKYYKGLGTSTAAEAKEYFRNLRKNTTVVAYTAEGREALDLAFRSKRADDRKAAIHFESTAYVDYSQPTTTIAHFVHFELLPQYARASVERALPGLDGLKVVQRKILFGMKKLKLSDVSVANTSGKIAVLTNYHHRGAALENAIVGMARNYVGEGLNLLEPLGQFGSRYNHQAAASAYIKTKLADVANFLYPSADDVILKYAVEEGVEVEPVLYVPVVAAVLLFGISGIATGWSTEIPCFDPIELVDSTICLLEGQDVPELCPSFRGFKGKIERDGDDFCVKGLCEWRGADLHIFEVPPGKEIQKYKEQWMEHASDVLFGEQNTEESLHLILKNCTQAPNLERKINMKNMNIFHEGVQKLSVLEIMNSHAKVRLETYQKRIGHEISVLETKALIATQRSKFAELVAEKKIDISQPEHEIVQILTSMLFDPIDEFAHLLDLPIRTITNRERLDDKRDALQKELEKVKSQTPTSLWKRELMDLRNFLASECNERDGGR
jgi:DNA topoisomerase-2